MQQGSAQGALTARVAALEAGLGTILEQLAALKERTTATETGLTTVKESVDSAAAGQAAAVESKLLSKFAGVEERNVRCPSKNLHFPIEEC